MSGEAFLKGLVQTNQVPANVGRFKQESIIAVGLHSAPGEERGSIADLKRLTLCPQVLDAVFPAAKELGEMKRRKAAQEKRCIRNTGQVPVTESSA